MEARLTSGPPPMLERAVLWLVPPVVREEVAGDLWERYCSPLQYLIDAIKALPWIVASQARRATQIPLFLLLALMVLASHGGLEPDRGTVAGVPIAARALVATLAVLAAFVLRNAYRPSDNWTAVRALGDATWLLAALLASQAALALLAAAGVLDPTWRLPLGWLAGGFVFYSVVMLLLRTELDSVDSKLRGQPRDAAAQAAALRQGLRLRLKLEATALSALALAMAWYALRASPVVAGVFGLWAALTLGFVVWRLHGHGRREFDGGRDACLAELVRQRDAGRPAWWYFAPLFFGLGWNTVAFGVGTAQPAIIVLGVGACALLGAMIVRLGAWRKRQLGERIAELERL